MGGGSSIFPFNIIKNYFNFPSRIGGESSDITLLLELVVVAILLLKIQVFE